MALLPRGAAGAGGISGDCAFPGGQTGQILTKKSAEDCDVLWAFPVPAQLYYRGAFDTPEQLFEARPADVTGAYAVVFSTSTFWVWDKDTDFWKNTGNTVQEGGIAEAPIDGLVYARKNAAWFALPDDRPQKPQNISPADGENEVYQFADFVGTNYVQRNGKPMRGMEIKIASDAAFENTVFGEVFYQDITTVTMNGSELAANTRFYWKIRYQSSELLWSDWSDATSFSTRAVYEDSVIKTPRILYPSEGGGAPGVNAALICSEMEYFGSATTHAKTSWRVQDKREVFSIGISEDMEEYRGWADLRSVIPFSNQWRDEAAFAARCAGVSNIRQASGAKITKYSF